jgi:hypothetical protein
MDRRTFGKLAGMAAFGAVAETPEARAQTSADSSVVQRGSEVTLEDSDLLVAFDSISGALVRMVRKSSNWVVERRPELGASFRLFVPLTKRRDNFVHGAKQRAVRVEKVGSNQVHLRWENLESDHGGVLPIAFAATVTLEKGKLTFTGELENNSEFSVEAIDYPYFGDFNPPSRDSYMEAHHLWVGALSADPIYPRFDNAKGYWGVR